MCRIVSWLVIALVVSAFIGCASGKSPTPPATTDAYHALLDSLVDSPPEAAIARLEKFLNENLDYEIAEMVEAELADMRTATTGRYHDARELAREGQFDLAERILQDLARNVPETTDGRSAEEHLRFEFYFGKAKWLLLRQRHEECRVLASRLLDHDLSPTESAQVEALLDNAGYVDAALSQAERANAQNVCRQLMVMLVQRYVEEGSYPPRLTIKEIEAWGPHNSQFILRGISAIENYETAEDNFSFTAVSAEGSHRIRVVNGQIVR